MLARCPIQNAVPSPSTAPATAAASTLPAQIAAGHQRAQRQDDGRAGITEPTIGNGFQQRRQKQRQIGKPRMCRDKRNQWIDQ